MKKYVIIRMCNLQTIIHLHMANMKPTDLAYWGNKSKVTMGNWVFVQCPTPKSSSQKRAHKIWKKLADIGIDRIQSTTVQNRPVAANLKSATCGQSCPSQTNSLSTRWPARPVPFPSYSSSPPTVYTRSHTFHLMRRTIMIVWTSYLLLRYCTKVDM